MTQSAVDCIFLCSYRCSYCAEDWSHPGLRGECSPCSDSLSIVWVIIATIFALLLVTGVLYFVSGVGMEQTGWRKQMTIAITFGKIGISLIQITTQLGIAFQVSHIRLHAH
jgi:hypothetical protein